MISDAEATDHCAQVTIDGVRQAFSWTWLRDHAGDPESFHARSNQRLVPAAVAAAASPAEVGVEPGGGALIVDWPGGPTAVFPEGALTGLALAARTYDVFADAQEPWPADSSTERLHRATFAGFTDDDAAFADSMHALRRDGVAVVERVPVDREATRTVLERMSYVRASIFGDVWRFGSDGELDDTASTRLEITPHTDGTYSRDAPGLLSLHCHSASTTGGESVLVDGLALHRQLTDIDPVAAETLETVQIPGRYLGDGSDLVAWRPAFRMEGGRLAQVSYNNHDRAPFRLPLDEERRFYGALQLLEELIARPGNRVEIRLAEGQMILIDNWRLLHGRRSFTGSREMAGGYLNREDLESVLRRLDGA